MASKVHEFPNAQRSEPRGVCLALKCPSCRGAVDRPRFVLANRVRELCSHGFHVQVRMTPPAYKEVAGVQE